MLTTDSQGDDDFRDLARYVDSSGRIVTWPGKRQRQFRALQYLAQKLEPKRIYTERELGWELLMLQTCKDAAMIRRELFEAGLVGREPDGSSYWVIVTPRSRNDEGEEQSHDH